MWYFSLSGFNRLTLKFSIIQVTGGGGYTKENVARCWAVETGVLLDTELPNGISLIHFQLSFYISSLSFLFLGEAACSLNFSCSFRSYRHVVEIY